MLFPFCLHSSDKYLAEYVVHSLNHFSGGVHLQSIFSPLKGLGVRKKLGMTSWILINLIFMLYAVKGDCHPCCVEEICHLGQMMHERWVKHEICQICQHRWYELESSETTSHCTPTLDRRIKKEWGKEEIIVRSVKV